MKLRDYLFWKKWNIGLSLCGIFVLNLFLIAAKVDSNNYIGITIILLISFLLKHIFSYVKAKKYFNELLDNVHKMDKAYINDVIPVPYNLETSLFTKVLKDNITTYNRDISTLESKGQAYKDYIEQWVHEIKLPISTIGLITDNSDDVVIKSVQEEIDSIEFYVEQVLFYAKSEYVEKDYLIKRVNIADSIRSALKKHKRLFIGHKVNLSINIRDCNILSDSKWLDFIIRQLLVNAVKYSAINKKKICIDISEQDNPLTLSIVNNGLAIPPEDINHIFEKGYIGKNGRNNQRSTGMGLYLVKTLCRKLGHDVQVNSTVDRTEFKVIFSEFREF